MTNSSWALAAVGVGALAGAALLALRMRRPKQLAIVLILCVFAAVIGRVLSARLA